MRRGQPAIDGRTGFLHHGPMNPAQPKSYQALLTLTVIFSLLAIVTMIPNPGASKPNVLGYRSVCSFAPAASALCGLLAGITCTLRNRRFSRNASAARYRPLFVPAGVGLLLAVIALVFGIRFGAAQSRFRAVISETRAALPAAELSSLSDGTRRATAADGEVSATVEVTVAAGRISAMKLVAGKNVDEGLAATLFARVREKGALTVDAVSGATASSAVLLKAIGDAARAP
jgi:uncharacterized protein with FMN-binding domain